MNANALADLLNECILDGSTDLVCVEQAATMLRQMGLAESIIKQQQAEIEALKAENKFFKNLMGDVEILRKAQEK